MPNVSHKQIIADGDVFYKSCSFQIFGSLQCKKLFL